MSYNVLMPKRALLWQLPLLWQLSHSRTLALPHSRGCGGNAVVHSWKRKETARHRQAAALRAAPGAMRGAVQAWADTADTELRPSAAASQRYVVGALKGQLHSF